VRGRCKGGAKLSTCPFECPNGALQRDIVDSIIIIQGVRLGGVDGGNIAPGFLILCNSHLSGGVDQLQEGLQLSFVGRHRGRVCVTAYKCCGCAIHTADWSRVTLDEWCGAGAICIAQAWHKVTIPYSIKTNEHDDQGPSGRHQEVSKPIRGARAIVQATKEVEDSAGSDGQRNDSRAAHRHAATRYKSKLARSLQPTDKVRQLKRSKHRMTSAPRPSKSPRSDPRRPTTDLSNPSSRQRRMNKRPRQVSPTRAAIRYAHHVSRWSHWDRIQVGWVGCIGHAL
jgi:hypothetical protein